MKIVIIVALISIVVIGALVLWIVKLKRRLYQSEIPNILYKALNHDRSSIMDLPELYNAFIKRRFWEENFLNFTSNLCSGVVKNAKNEIMWGGLIDLLHEYRRLINVDTPNADFSTAVKKALSKEFSHVKSLFEHEVKNRKGTNEQLIRFVDTTRMEFKQKFNIELPTIQHIMGVVSPA